ncbi:hypothetical protein MTR67_002297, partial [Solanum verrucosum]
ICAAADHSVTLFGITNKLGDSPFGVVHRRFAPSFGIACSRSLGDIILLCETSRRCADCFFFRST